MHPLLEVKLQKQRFTPPPKTCHIRATLPKACDREQKIEKCVKKRNLIIFLNSSGTMLAFPLQAPNRFFSEYIPDELKQTDPYGKNKRQKH